MKVHVRKNDTVLVISGKDKGKTGEILKVYPKTGKVLVKGINIVKKHQKASRTQAESAIIEKEASINSKYKNPISPVLTTEPCRCLSLSSSLFSSQ